MTERKAITESDKAIIESWYKQPSGEVESVDAFIKKLDDEYKHDYGTICHAVAAAAIRAAWAMNAQSQGGITGFQAGAVMWEFIQHWMHKEGPMRLVEYKDMLFPQHADKFDKIISKDVWETLQKEAQNKLDKEKKSEFKAHPRVVAHWESIVHGVVPFGYKVKEGDG